MSDTGTLTIKPAEACKYDGAAAGETMMRLDPTPYPTARANTLNISFPLHTLMAITSVAQRCHVNNT